VTTAVLPLLRPPPSAGRVDAFHVLVDAPVDEPGVVDEAVLHLPELGGGLLFAVLLGRLQLGVLARGFDSLEVDLLQPLQLSDLGSTADGVLGAAGELRNLVDGLDVPLRVLEELVDVLSEHLFEVGVLLNLANLARLLLGTGYLLPPNLLHLLLLEESLSLGRVQHLLALVEPVPLVVRADLRAHVTAHV